MKRLIINTLAIIVLSTTPFFAQAQDTPSTNPETLHLTLDQALEIALS